MAADDHGSSIRRSPSVGDGFVVAGFAGVIVVTYLLGIALGSWTDDGVILHETIYRPILFPGLFVFAPPVVAVANLLRGGSALGSLAVGLVPGVAFAALAIVSGLLGTGVADSPLWAMVVTFGGIGLLGAAAGVASYAAVERLSRHVT